MAWKHSRLGSEKRPGGLLVHGLGDRPASQNHTCPQLRARPLDGALLFRSKRAPPRGDC